MERLLTVSGLTGTEVWSLQGKLEERKGDASPPLISPEREGLYKIGGSRRARPVAMEER